MCISVTEIGDQFFVILSPTYCTKTLCVAVCPPYFFARQLHFLSYSNICNLPLQFRGSVSLMLLLLRVSTHMPFHLGRSRAWMFRQGAKSLKYTQKGLAESERELPSIHQISCLFFSVIFKLNDILLVSLWLVDCGNLVLTPASPG